MAKAKQNEVMRVGRFGLVGIINTLIDLTIFNLLTRGSKVTSVLIRANLVSTTVAMIFSFFANQIFVFKASRKDSLIQALKFFPITAFGLYVLQNGTIAILTHYWTAPISLGLTVAHAIGVSKFLSDDFLTKNGAKAAAIAISLTWNYVMYKKVVFRR